MVRGSNRRGHERCEDAGTPVYSTFSNPQNTPPLSGSLAPVTLDAAGNIYGTTVGDGVNSLGSVFKLTRNGGDWDYTSLHDFAGNADGSRPISNVSLGVDGNFYGTAVVGGTGHSCPSGFNEGCGVIWQITP